MNFSRFLDIQSWWEVPSIAYFCSLFRTAFNLLDFDIEELEEALLTDGTEDSGSSLLTELIVRLLNGCLGNNDISAFNYQMYLRRLFRQKCQESGRYNPFNTDIDFQFLPLRRKVEILYALCDFRLDAEDVFDLFKNLEAESLRVEPLGWDDNDSAYWYFYGTRLYREDIIRKPKAKKKKKNKDKKRGWLHGDECNEDETERVWQVVCFTEEDWTNLTQKFSKATSKIEKELFRSLSQNFMPEIPRLFHEKERLQRKRLLELAPRRTSSRVLEKIRQKEEEESSKATTDVEVSKDSDSIESQNSARRNRAKRRNFLRSKSRISTSDSSGNSEGEEMPRAVKPKKGTKKSKIKEDAENSAPQEPPIRTGRKTNNSLASATFQNDQIVIPDNDEPINSTRKKLKTSQIFSQTKEDIQTDMYKVLEQLRNHQDAWPFLDPVEEDYAPNYYSIIRRPMDLHTMEERLDSGYYMDFATFKADFKLIVSNCRLYNGQDNEYTMMVDNLQAEFDRLTEKYMYPVSSSDEEIAVEYQMPTPARRQKRKGSDSPSRVAGKRKKHKSQSESGEPKCSTSSIIEDQEQEVKCDNSDYSDRELSQTVTEMDNNKGETEEDRSNKISKESRNEKGKKRHRHGKHSKVHKKKQHSSKTKHNKKHNKKNEKSGIKSKQKKSKQIEQIEPECTKQCDSQECLSSSNSRSASPLPSIHTPTPSPTEVVEPKTSKTKANLNQPHSSKCHNARIQYLIDKIDNFKFPKGAVAKHIFKQLFGNEKTKKNLIAPKRDKNQKLRETIEKLKAKNKKCRDPSLFTSLFSPRSGRRVERKPDYKEDSDEDGSDNEPLENVKGKCNNRKLTKKCSSKSESTSEALEEAMKDISKWLEDMPEKSVGSSLESSAPSVTTEEQDSSSRQDYESLLSEKSTTSKKDFTRKRQSLRELKLVRKREIQRTIDRLQPGKSKGNLLTNFPKNIEDYVEYGDSSQNEETSPKLNLGSVLPTVDFQLSQECSIRNVLTEELPITSTETEAPVEDSDKKESNETVVLTTQKDEEDECEPSVSKLSQEKATPNLSAWFKAFGAPKTTVPPTSVKKKSNTDNEGKPVKPEITEVKVSPKINSSKIDSPNDPNSPNHDGGDSTSDTIVVPPPLPRRTSTGSSVSEQSCLSQDLDSPRHQMSHTSPLIRSPASPRYYDGVIINGTVRAGFYQDTTSVKSSPDKICSPREAPQSPFSSSPLHVYAASAGSQATIAPNYFVDPNKSPLLINTQTTSSFYEQNKAATLSKTPRLPTDANQPFSPVSPDYSPKQPHYIPSPLSDQVQSNCDNENKSSFSVKKRTYNELQETEVKPLDKGSNTLQPQRNEVVPLNQTLPAFSNVDNVLSVEVEKKVEDNSDMKYAKTINSLYENNEPAHANNKPLEMTKKNAVDMVNMGYFISEEAKGQTTELRDVEYFAREREICKTQRRYELDSVVMNSQLPKPLTKPNISTYNYTPAHTHERHNDVNLKQTISHAHQNPYDSLASGQQMSSLPFKVGRLSFNDIDSANKKLYSNSISSTPLDFGNWREPNQGHKQDPLPAHFSTATNSNGNETNSTNKKQYSDNISSTPLDFGNWRDTDHTLKQDQLPADFSANTNSDNDNNLVNKKHYTNSISSAPLNFGYWKNPTPTRKQERVSANISSYVDNNEKNLQQQQYNNYALPRITSHKVPTNSTGPAELRIPNPRATMPKSDNTNVQLSTTKKTQNNTFAAMPYKNPYISHATLYDSIEPMRNLDLLERHSDANERYLSTFANNVSLYQSKLFGKGLGKEINTPNTSNIIYTQVQMNLESGFENKSTTKRKWIESKQSAPQAYPASSCGDNVLTSGKTSSIIPPTTFNFGSTTMSLGSMYGDNSGFSIENFRNSTTQLMAANYMAAAVANRNNSATAEKFVQPAHQNNHGGSTYPFMTHSQAPAGYPFVGTDASSPLYQQYIQRYQEELQRQTGAQIMGLYPPTYPPTLGVRQPYDSINRPSWI
ncbi:uncharacterized protein LOC110995408 isoform X1 [Pieris rapae]|uniref:uncharacterized protein LOC110995408 isoform X1 n=1 Tax=Pieris rapae TaxID=64459 RepID=UPI001E27B18D|nr:uncharacterized protein LOC110995408 isoform X1 [Pieris rapae]